MGCENLRLFNKDKKIRFFSGICATINWIISGLTWYSNLLVRSESRTSSYWIPEWSEDRYIYIYIEYSGYKAKFYDLNTPCINQYSYPLGSCNPERWPINLGHFTNKNLQHFEDKLEKRGRGPTDIVSQKLGVVDAVGKHIRQVSNEGLQSHRQLCIQVLVQKYLRSKNCNW